MSLNVGELTGLITIDGSGVDPGLRRAERSMQQSGDRMGDDAERAGRQAGENLGEGLVRSADGRLRDLRGRFVAATQQASDAAANTARQEGEDVGENLGEGVVRGADGRLRDLRGRFITATHQAGDAATTAARREGEDAGEAFGDGLGEGAQQGGDDAADAAGKSLEKVKTAAAGIGVAAGALLMSALADAMDQSKITGRLGAQLGATPAEAEKYGHIAGQLYAKAITEDFQGAADAISATMRAGLLPPDATNAQIESIATKVSDLATTFELDLGQAANAVGQIMKTGLAPNAESALDTIARGLQVMGPRADDIADTFNEYSTIFRQLGISARDATGIMSQGLKAGARDTDVVADSLKELVLITQGGGKEVDAAFAKIGLSGKEMQQAFSEGGPAAEAALDKLFDGLRKVKDPADRSALALTLFGTKSEDMQKALFAIDPSKAVDSLGKVGGAAEKMGNSLRDNAGARVEAFKRQTMQGLVDFLGGTVIPGLDAFRTRVGGVFGRLWEEAGKSGAIGVDRVISMFGLLGVKLVQKIKEFAPRAVEALSGFGQAIADYVMANPAKVFKIAAIAGAILIGLSLLPFLIAAGLGAVATTIAVGFVGRLLTAFNENLPKWWQGLKSWVGAKASEAGSLFSALGSAIGAWFGGLWSRYIGGPVSRAWSSFITSVRALPGRSVAALSALGSALGAAAGTGWQRFKDGSVRKGGEFLTWVRGLPGRARSALGSLGGVLLSAGASLINGFISGIKSKFGSVKSTLGGLTSSLTSWKGPENLDKRLLTPAGHYLIEGFQRGIDAQTPALRRQLQGLTSALPSMAGDSSMAGLATAAAPGSTAAAPAVGGTASSQRLVRVDLGGELGDAIVGILRDKIGIGGGDVQLYLGKVR